MYNQSLLHSRYNCMDHVHMYVSIPPKESVAKIVGSIKGKSSLMLFDRHPKYRDRHGR